MLCITSTTCGKSGLILDIDPAIINQVGRSSAGKESEPQMWKKRTAVLCALILMMMPVLAASAEQAAMVEETVTAEETATAEQAATAGEAEEAAPSKDRTGPDPYVPERKNIFIDGMKVPELEVEGKDGVEYEAHFDGGALKTLDVSLEDKDGKEYEVSYNSRGRIVSAEVKDGSGTFTYDGRTWKDAAGNVVKKGPDLSFVKKYYESFAIKGTWYTDNTMGLVGLSLREMYPSLTNKWYNVVPVDLTKDGVYTYRTAASNLYYMGICRVTIEYGKVTVDYTLPNGKVYLIDQCMNWFTGIDEITSAYLENPTSTYRYGEPVDIQEELGGAKIALLFMCNHVTYSVPMTARGKCPKRFYASTGYVVDLRAELKGLLAQMEK